MIYESSGTTRHDSVAQLDRVTDYESVGLGFESLPGHQTIFTRTPQHFDCGVFEYIGNCSVVIIYVYTLSSHYDTTDEVIEGIEAISVFFICPFCQLVQIIDDRFFCNGNDVSL